MVSPFTALIHMVWELLDLSSLYGLESLGKQDTSLTRKITKVRIKIIRWMTISQTQDKYDLKHKKDKVKNMVWMSTIKWIRFLDLEQHLRTKILKYLEVYLLFTNRLIADIWKKLKKKKNFFLSFLYGYHSPLHVLQILWVYLFNPSRNNTLPLG